MRASLWRSSPLFSEFVSAVQWDPYRGFPIRSEWPDRHDPSSPRRHHEPPAQDQSPGTASRDRHPPPFRGQFSPVSVTAMPVKSSAIRSIALRIEPPTGAAILRSQPAATGRAARPVVRRRDPTIRDPDAVRRGDLRQCRPPGLPSTSRTPAADVAVHDRIGGVGRKNTERLASMTAR